MIKYGILGCGGHALQSHAIPGKLVSSLQLSSLYDVNKDSIDAFVPEFGLIPSYQTEEAFFASGISAVVIATPDRWHAKNLNDAVVEHGLHALVEKPIATTGPEADIFNKILSGTAKLFNIVVSSCHPRRFDPPFIGLKQHLNWFVEVLGPVVSFDFDFSYHKPTALWKEDRSLLLDHFSHEIDLLHFLFGPCRFSANAPTDAFDRYEVTGLRRDGISFRFQGTRRLESRQFLEWATIRHERGSVRVDTEKGVLAWHNHEQGTTGEIIVGPTDYPKRFLGVMQNFADAIEGSKQCYLSHQDLLTNTYSAARLANQGALKNFWIG